MRAHSESDSRRPADRHGDEERQENQEESRSSSRDPHVNNQTLHDSDMRFVDERESGKDGSGEENNGIISDAGCS